MAFVKKFRPLFITFPPFMSSLPLCPSSLCVLSPCMSIDEAEPVFLFLLGDFLSFVGSSPKCLSCPPLLGWQCRDLCLSSSPLKQQTCFVCRRHVKNVIPTRRRHSLMSANFLSVGVVSLRPVADIHSYMNVGFSINEVVTNEDKKKMECLPPRYLL